MEYVQIIKFLNFSYHFQLFGVIRGSYRGSTFDCQRPIGSPLPEALTLRSIFSTFFWMPSARYIEYGTVCFSVPLEGNAAASLIVISLHSINEKNKVLPQPGMAQIARCQYDICMAEICHFDFVPYHTAFTPCKIKPKICFCKLTLALWWRW